MAVKERDVLVGRLYLMTTSQIRRVLRVRGDQIEYAIKGEKFFQGRQWESREAFAAAAQKEIGS